MPRDRLQSLPGRGRRHPRHKLPRNDAAQAFKGVGGRARVRRRGVRGGRGAAAFQIRREAVALEDGQQAAVVDRRHVRQALAQAPARFGGGAFAVL